MARFEIEMNGKRFEVEAPDQATAVQALQGMAGPAEPDAYGEALAAASQASQSLNYDPNAVRQGSPDLMGSTASTLGGLVNGIPVLGPAVQNISDALVGTGAQLTGGNYGETVQGLQERRRELANANPIANIAGNIGGGIGAVGVAGLSSAGAQALGLTGGLGQQVLNSGLSTMGLTAADNMVRGDKPTDALAAAVAPAALSAAIPVLGQGLRKGADGIADALTRRAQNGLTTAAIQGAPDAAALKSAASAMFDASTGGTPLAINDNAFFRFLGGVKQYADKLRINADNDPQATGLLSTLMRIADDTGSGVAVDMKDLHLVRQLARKVSASNSGRDASMGSEVVRQLDDLIEGLSPTDILGGADPSAASDALMRGISTWSRASKVGLIEEAIEKAGTYKSGTENGLRLQFQALLRNPETRRLFNAVERAEIEKVANGTAGSNLITLLGKFGFGTNGATNMLGGTIGSFGAASVLGPVGGVAAALAGTGARKLSETLGVNAANRATQVVATEGVPIAAQRQVPDYLLQAIQAGQIAGKGAVIGGNANVATY